MIILCISIGFTRTGKDFPKEDFPGAMIASVSAGLVEGPAQDLGVKAFQAMGSLLPLSWPLAR